ncbi:MAG: META domain-containing protein [Deltaproteobacteria bacterium]|nr:META domain-containing protein [Deltaproteobacteria bacterium]
MRGKPCISLLVTTICIFCLTACASTPGARSASSPPQEGDNDISRTWLLRNQLANTTYRSKWTQSDTVTLTNGQYREPAAPGSASETVVMLLDTIAFGRIDEQNAAALILTTNAGGSGTFFDLVLVLQEADSWTNVASASLGDRVKINSVSIRDGSVFVDMVGHREDDPMCCPTQQEERKYALQADRLVLSPAATPAAAGDAGAHSPIVDVKWNLIEIQWMNDTRDLVDDTLKYTLELKPDGAVSIRADCNSGFGTYTLEGGALTIDIAGTTMAACPPGSLYDTYLRSLGQIYGFVLEGEFLYLSMRMDSGIMKFAKGQPEH